MLLEIQFRINLRTIITNKHMQWLENIIKILKSNCHCQIRVFSSRVYKHCHVIIEINKNHEVLCQFFNPSKWISCLHVLSYPFSEFNCISIKIPQLSLWIFWLKHHIWWSIIYNTTKHSIKIKSFMYSKENKDVVHWFILPSNSNKQSLSQDTYLKNNKRKSIAS